MKSKIDFEVFNNKELTKEQIASWLKKDIEGVYILLAEFLRSEEIFNALLNVYWERYEALKNTQELVEKTKPE